MSYKAEKAQLMKKLDIKYGKIARRYLAEISKVAGQKKQLVDLSKEEFEQWLAQLQSQLNQPQNQQMAQQMQQANQLIANQNRLLSELNNQLRQLKNDGINQNSQASAIVDRMLAMLNPQQR